MAEDQTQRPYRLNDPPVRRSMATPTASSSGSDPLAELARLIGQTDPFGEFGRDNTRRAAAPPPVAAPPAAPKFGANDQFAFSAAPPPAARSAVPDTRAYGVPGAARQPYVGVEDHQHDETETYGHPAAETDEFAPEHPQSNAQLAAEEGGFYEDVPPKKRRIGVLGIAAILALAVIGSAGAFGYRALFGPSRSATPPPVIKADAAPSKIVPAAASKTPNKMITDRVADRAQDEKIVSREERPVEIKNNPAAAPAPQTEGGPPPAATQTALGSGVIASEPKKVHTIAIRPDQASAADGQPVIATAPPPAPAPAPVKQASPPAPAPAKQAAAPVAASSDPPPVPSSRPAEARASAPPRQATAPAPKNAPLSLSPDAPAAPAAAAPAPTRTASVAPPAAKTASPAGGAYVQLSSQRSEAEAQAALRTMQAKYASQLGGKQTSIHKVELGAKGTYYRALVGPFASANEASELCNGLKSAGGQCIVQRN
jgi:hypothetical protein